MPTDRRQTVALEFLRTAPLTSAATLAAELGVSQPTVSRTLHALGRNIVRIGRARAARYIARRPLEDVEDPIPVYEIQEDGTSTVLGRLHPVLPEGFVFESELVDRLSTVHVDDLPYWMADMTPTGFLGRLLARRHGDLGLPPDARLWTSTHVLAYLTKRGAYAPGNLVVGEEAFRLYLEDQAGATDFVSSCDVSEVYPRFADDVLASGPVGSSAGGEHPKFLARLDDGRPVLVKFSPPQEGELAQRVADLLVAEHLALTTMAEHGDVAAKSTILHAGTRTFLEVERFDRTQGGGRRGVVSMHALDAEFVGGFRDWVDTAKRLVQAQVLEEPVLEGIKWRFLFGQLIGNTDMHMGNLAFYTTVPRIDALAPAYDMLPMLYAPVQNQLLAREFEVPIPSPELASVWDSAWQAACAFWKAVSEDERISPAFRTVARGNRSTVERASELGRRLPR